MSVLPGGRALASRFIVLTLQNSFLGCEDTELEAELHAELTGILAWAVEGWRKLQSDGRLLQPAASAEVIQELSSAIPLTVHFSATAIEMVRGVLVTAHVMLPHALSDKEIWGIYREAYKREPFLRIVKERRGVYRYPEPKILAGSNFCDVGFETDPHSGRLVVLSALDNLVKGGAGNGVQAMNGMLGLDETTGLEFPGLHPV